MKKYKFTRNPGLKLLAFVFAAFLWLIVVNIDNPVSSDTYLNVPVTIVNEDIITQEGNVYQVVGDQSATVTVYAKRQTLQDINADDITDLAKNIADFSKKQKASGKSAEEFLKSAKRFKVGSVVGNIGISCLFLGFIVPKLMKAYKDKYYGEGSHIQKGIQEKIARMNFGQQL